MTTFSGWLDDQASPTLARQDAIGDLARAWLAAKGDRPRVFAPESVSAWVLAHLPEALHPAVREAVTAYRASRSGTVAPVPDPPHQAGPPGHQMPIVDLSNPGPAFMAALGRIERVLGDLAPGGAPVAGMVEMIFARLGGIHERLQRIEAWQGEQDKRIEPITRLLTELGMAEDQADQADLESGHQAAEEAQADAGQVPGVELAPEQNAWGPPVVQPSGSLWRNIAAPEPDFAAMAQDGDPAAEEAGGEARDQQAARLLRRLAGLLPGRLRGRSRPGALQASLARWRAGCAITRAAGPNAGRYSRRAIAAFSGALNRLPMWPYTRAFQGKAFQRIGHIRAFCIKALYTGLLLQACIEAFMRIAQCTHTPLCVLLRIAHKQSTHRLHRCKEWLAIPSTEVGIPPRPPACAPSAEGGSGR